MKQNILFLTCTNSEFPVQLEVARKLKGNKFIRVIFCFNAIANDLKTQMRRCREEGFDLIEIFENNTSTTPNENKLTSHRRENQIKKRVRVTLSDLPHIYNKRRSDMNSFRDMMNVLALDIIILSNNKFVFLIPYLIKAAHLEDIIVIFLPFGMESLKTYHLKLDDAVSDDISKWSFFHFLFPKWTIKTPYGINKLGLSIAELLVMTLLSAAPEYPTSPYGGNADYMFSENEYMFNFYKHLTSRRTKIINTGTPNNDILHTALMNRRKNYDDLCTKYGVKNDKALIVVSLPQYLPSSWKGVKEYDSYLSFVRIFFSNLSIAGGDYNVFISIHPRMNQTAIRNQAAPFTNITIVEEYIAYLIPLSEFYVCSESSTIRMAIACNKPVINYDFYSLNYDLFSEEQGVITIASEEAFVKALVSFCNKDSTFFYYLTNQKNIQDQFGPINGNALDEIIHHILNILSKRRKQ